MIPSPGADFHQGDIAQHSMYHAGQIVILKKLASSR
jgi:hypothetical protein